MNVKNTHLPVMLAEMIDALAPREGDIIVDGTFGAGGYSTAILKTGAGHVYAIDRDPAARARYDALPDALKQNCTFIDAAFSDIAHELESRNITAVDGIVLDLGVSSPQLDDAARGFSFRFDGPLDMRMDPRRGQSAADLVNTLSERDLADIIYQYGEEKKSRRVAHAIVEARKTAPLTSTSALAALVRSVVRSSPKDTIDPCTRTFQGLRIAVNAELDELRVILMAALKLLRAGGRLVVVTFHSLEDRIVKQFFQTYGDRAPKPSRHTPDIEVHAPLFTLLSARAIDPGAEEVARNPRARSAHLRAGLRTDAPLWPQLAGEAA